MSCPQIWNIEKEKDREKEKVGGRPAMLNGEKSDRELGREIKKVAMRKSEMLAATKVNMSGSEKKKANKQKTKNTTTQHVRQFLHKTCS